MHVSFFVPETSPKAEEGQGTPTTTVADLLDLPELGAAQILAGHPGTTRGVTAVLSVDDPEAARWLTGGEFVVTTGAPARAGGWAAWLAQLVRAKAAAVLVLHGAEGADVPPEALKATGDLPVIALQHVGDLQGVLEPLRIAADRGADARQRQGMMLQRQLLQLVLDGQGLEEVVRRVAASLGAPVMVEDRQFNLLASANPGQSTATLFDDVIAGNGTPVAVLKRYEDAGLLRQMRQDKAPVTVAADDQHPQVRHIHPVIVGGEPFGYLSVIEVLPLSPAEFRLAMESAVPAIAVELLKQRGIAENDQKVRREFFRDLLFSNGNISPETLHRRATYLGYQLSTSYWALNVDFDAVPNEELLPEQIKRLGSTLNSLLSFRQALVITQPQGATVLYPVKEGQPNLEKIKHLAETIRQKVEQTLAGWTVSVGCGQLYPDLLAIPRSYKEAQHAVKIGRALHGPNRVTCFGELGIYRMLLQFANSQDPTEFFCEALGRLLDYDQQADKELVKTLTAFLECNGNLTETSDRLFIHRNTLKYRLERIRDITQIDLDDSENRLMLHLGLKMNQILTCVK